MPICEILSDRPNVPGNSIHFMRNLTKLRLLIYLQHSKECMARWSARHAIQQSLSFARRSELSLGSTATIISLCSPSAFSFSRRSILEVISCIFPPQEQEQEQELPFWSRCFALSRFESIDLRRFAYEKEIEGTLSS